MPHTVLNEGSAYIGKVTSGGVNIALAVTVDTAAYQAGDCIGGKLTLPNAVRAAGEKSWLVDVHILDRSNQKPAGTILLFNADPTAATITDNAAFVYATDDLKQIAKIDIASADYVTINGKATLNKEYVRQVAPASGTTLYAVFVAGGASDFVAATDLYITFKFAYL